MGSQMSSALGGWCDLTIKAELFIVFYFIPRLQNLGPGALMANIKQLQRRQMGK